MRITTILAALLFSTAAVAQQGGGQVNGPIPPSGSGGVIGSFTAGDIPAANARRQLVDSLHFGQNGGISLSGGGIPSYGNCFWSDQDSCVPENIHMRERSFFGNAVLSNDRRGTATGSATWWNTLPTNQQGSYYLLRDAQVASMTDRGTIALSGMTLSSQGDADASLKGAPIGVAGYCNNNTSKANSNCWAGYFENIYTPNGVVGFSFGLEIDTRNTTSTNYVPNPYSIGQGDYPLWVACGAGLSSGTGATNPCAAGMVLTQNQQTFNVGLIFRDGSLTKDGSNNSVAIEMGQGATIQWQISSGVVGANIRSTVSTSGDDMSILFSNNQIHLSGPSAADQLIVNGSPSTSAPTLAFAICGSECGILAGTANGGSFSFITPSGSRWLDYSSTSSGVATMGVTLSMGSQNITNANTISATNAGGYLLTNAAASSTVPTLLPTRGSSTTGFGAQAAGNISAIVTGTEVARFVAGGLILPTVTTGTPAASLCVDASNNVIVKTTTGPCV